MTQRGYPLWLLRDVRTLAAVTLSFRRLMIFLIIGGDDAMRHEAFRIYYRSKAADLLASAEQHLDRALWREAYRRLGWDPRLAPTSDIQPPEDDALLARTKAYRDAFFNMEGVVRAYVDHLCARYSVAKSARVAHGAKDARLCRAAHLELVGAAALFSQHASIALILSSARSARPSKDERGHAHARAPPTFLNFLKSNPPYLAALRSETAPACAKP